MVNFEKEFKRQWYEIYPFSDVIFCPREMGYADIVTRAFYKGDEIFHEARYSVNGLKIATDGSTKHAAKRAIEMHNQWFAKEILKKSMEIAVEE